MDSIKLRSLDTLNDAEVRAIMAQAADAMETLGWNGALRRGYDKTVCVLGAFEHAIDNKRNLGNSEGDNAFLQRVVDLLGIPQADPKHYPVSTPSWSLALWSNASKVKGRDVIDLLRSTAS